MVDIQLKIENDFDMNSIAQVTKTFLQKRCDFFQRYQKTDETIYTYLEVVRSLAECCNFYKIEEEWLIRDRLVSGLNDKELQIKLLETYENPTIEDILNICFSEIDYVENNAENENTDKSLDTKIVDEDSDARFPEIFIKEEANYASNDDDDVLEDATLREDKPKKPHQDFFNCYRENGWSYPKCSICDKSFDNFNYFKGHLVEHSVTANQTTNTGECTKGVCVLCKKKPKVCDDLVRHYASHAFDKDLNVPKVNCSMCGKLIAIRYFKIHMSKHSEINSFACTFCPKKFKSRYQFAAHIQIHNEHSTYICDICGSKFKRKNYVEAHKQRVHSLLDPKIHALECYVCKKQYASIETVKRHISLHFTQKNYLCTQCGDCFTVASGLERHLMREDHGGVEKRKFQCEICKRRFYNKTYYNRHKVVHTNERPFICKYENCGKTYRSPKGLKDHYRMHTGERPYHCKYCDYKSINSTLLNRHMLVHTGRPGRQQQQNAVSLT